MERRSKKKHNSRPKSSKPQWIISKKEDPTIVRARREKMQDMEEMQLGKETLAYRY